MNILSQEFLWVGIFSLALGYVIFLGLVRLLPKKLTGENQQVAQSEIKKARRRREQILKESVGHTEAKLKLSRESMETSFEEHLQSLKVAEEELVLQEEYVSQVESRVARQENEVANSAKKIEGLREIVTAEEERIEAVKVNVIEKLAEVSQTDRIRERDRIKDRLVADRQLEGQRRLKDLNEELGANSKRLADRMLSRLLARYEPVFIWPKSSGQVELPDEKSTELLVSGQENLLAELRELTQGVEIGFGTDDAGKPQYIRIVGGYGIYKEAAKLTLEDLLPKGNRAWAKAAQVYDRHKKALEAQALKLGRQALRELRLSPMSDEILKMVGALNWRTSYRQNQFYHSLEVAKLAGLLAHELKVDPEFAKRSGLLHDIGKTIDYRIEGSHAVISGDYADRYGESRLVCDTVMSHHNDLVLETPLAYVLKTADTLSGARPGARVNLEEGYQIRLSSIEQAVRSFPGIMKVEIMNGGREVHIDVNNKKVKETMLAELTSAIARKIEEEVAFPGQIRVIMSRRFEAVAVA
jgi:ribonuclease Y